VSSYFSCPDVDQSKGRTWRHTATNGLSVAIAKPSFLCNLFGMTKTQAQILELIAKLPLSERREVVDHIRETHLLDDSFYDSMSSEQREHLDEGSAQADRSEGQPATVVFDSIAKRHGIPQA
jgi:hypothetical protein